MTADFSIIEMLAVGSASGAAAAGGMVWYMLKRTYGDCVQREECKLLRDIEEQKHSKTDQSINDLKETLKAMSQNFKSELESLAASNREQHALILSLLRKEYDKRG